jgi:hypothetical protein
MTTFGNRADEGSATAGPRCLNGAPTISDTAPPREQLGPWRVSGKHDSPRPDRDACLLGEDGAGVFRLGLDERLDEQLDVSMGKVSTSITSRPAIRACALKAASTVG